MTSLLYMFRKFRYDLYDTRQNCSKFNLKLHLNMWFNDKVLNRSPISAGFPWVNYPLAQFFLNEISKNSVILEFGCGGSTLFFLKLKSSLISIEHEKEWLEKVKCKVPKNHQNNWLYHQVSLNSRAESSLPHDDYIKPLKEIENNTIHIAMVDGRHRVESLKAVIPKVRHNGWIVLDDSDRQSYSDVYKILNNWEMIELSGIAYQSDYKSHATLWRKPIN
jgi:hypothetical protein